MVILIAIFMVICLAVINRKRANSKYIMHTIINVRHMWMRGNYITQYVCVCVCVCVTNLQEPARFTLISLDFQLIDYSIKLTLKGYSLFAHFLTLSLPFCTQCTVMSE